MNWLGVVHKRRHGLRGGGGKGFFDDSTKALVIKPVTTPYWYKNEAVSRTSELFLLVNKN